jgi:5-formyltetrahydrofolate cyclo-ligase
VARKKPELTADDVKRWLRRSLIQHRQRVPASQQKKWSAAIARHWFRSPIYRKAKNIAAFVGFGSEVLTDGLIERAWKDGKSVLVPIASKGFEQPYFVLFRRGDKLRKTSFGPLELIEKKKPFNFRLIDAVLVPGLGFDSSGHRIGYGGGVYDRILKKTPRATHVGLFFSTQEVRRLPVEPHDERLRLILTEKGPRTI